MATGATAAGSGRRRERRLGRKAKAVFGFQLGAHPVLHGRHELRAQIGVQILGLWLQDAEFEAGLAASFAETLFGKIASRVIVAKHVEAAEREREQNGGEMGGGEARRHGQGRKEGEEREHGFDTLACRQHIRNLAKANRVAEKMAHGPARIGKRGFAVAVAGQPGALKAGEIAVKIGDDAKKRGPALARGIAIGAVVAGGMKAKRRPVEAGRDAAIAQICLGQRPMDGARQAIELFGGGGCIAVLFAGRTGPAGRNVVRLVQEAARFRKGLAQLAVALIEADEIEKVAMLSRGGIQLMCNCT